MVGSYFKKHVPTRFFLVTFRNCHRLQRTWVARKIRGRKRCLEDPGKPSSDTHDQIRKITLKTTTAKTKTCNRKKFGICLREKTMIDYVICTVIPKVIITWYHTCHTVGLTGWINWWMWKRTLARGISLTKRRVTGTMLRLKRRTKATRRLYLVMWIWKGSALATRWYFCWTYTTSIRWWCRNAFWSRYRSRARWSNFWCSLVHCWWGTKSFTVAGCQQKCGPRWYTAFYSE
jgi:hypothetical protein